MSSGYAPESPDLSAFQDDNAAVDTTAALPGPAYGLSSAQPSSFNPPSLGFMADPHAAPQQPFSYSYTSPTGDPSLGQYYQVQASPTQNPSAQSALPLGQRRPAAAMDASGSPPDADANATGQDPPRRGRKPKKPKIEAEVCDIPAPGVAEGIEVRTKFPVARIKRIMQADEDVGKVAQVTPTAVSKALELFMISLVTKAAARARLGSARKVSAAHLKQVVQDDEQFDFLMDIISKVPDAPAKGSKDDDSDGVSGPGEGRSGEGRGEGRPSEGPRRRAPARSGTADDSEGKPRRGPGRRRKQEDD